MFSSLIEFKKLIVNNALLIPLNNSKIFLHECFLQCWSIIYPDKPKIFVSSNYHKVSIFYHRLLSYAKSSSWWTWIAMSRCLFFFSEVSSCGTQRLSSSSAYVGIWKWLVGLFQVHLQVLHTRVFLQKFFEFFIFNFFWLFLHSRDQNFHS